EADEQVVDAAIGLEILPRPWIGVHPRVALSAVTRRFPGVVERQPRDRHGGATREHPDLLGVRYGVEVAGEDRRHALVGWRRDEAGDRGHLLRTDGGPGHSTASGW